MSGIFRELRRRNVFKVGMAYLAVAWLVIQLVGEIGPILDMPEWLPRLILALLAAGFIITLVLAWIYELTDRGIRTTEEVDRDASLRPAHGMALNFVIIGALSLALGYFIWESRFARESGREADVESIAVLPFTDMSAAGDQEYFADGMAEELLNLLSRLPDLKVAGRTSSFSFKGSGRDFRGIAGELGVTHILEGSVRTSGTRLRVTAQLVKAADGFQLWSDTYDRELRDVFAVQDDIANAVIEGLSAHLSPVAGRLPAVNTTDDMRAYDEYLLGRYHLARRTGEGLARALGHFQAAVQADPDFSPAWSGLAKTWVVSPYYAPLAPPLELAGEARAAAQKALQLDPGNSEAYAVIGTIHMLFDGDLERAAAALQTAVELHPNNAGNVNLYGDYLYMIGDYQSALEFERRAAELEPLSAANQHELALVYGLLGRLDAAIAQERLAVRLNPGFANAWSSLIRMLLESGDLSAARRLLVEQDMVLGQRRLEMLKTRLALADGDRAAAHVAALRVLDISQREGRSLAQPAWLFAMLGDDEQAAALVARAVDASDPLLNSPLYFFLPEDWAEMPRVRESLSHPSLQKLFDLRRRHIAAGRGRVKVAGTDR